MDALAASRQPGAAVLEARVTGCQAPT